MSRALRGLLLLGVVSSPAIAVDSTAEITPNEFSGIPWTRTTLASQWGLAQQEIDRLQQLVPAARPWTDVTMLTPYELLGMYARDDAERRRYAERFVAARVAHQRRALNWSVTVVEVDETGSLDTRLQTPIVQQYLARRGYNEATTGDAAPGPENSADRLHLFVATDGCARCTRAFQNAMALVQVGLYAGVDVIFTDMAHEDRKAATGWAMAHGIQPDMLENRQVSLNWENKRWLRERADRPPPLVVSARTGESLDTP